MQESGRSGTVVMLFSSASAAGKTTLAINLAAALAQKELRTCVVDLDLQFNDVCRFLKTEPQVTLFDYQNAVAENPEAAVEAYLTKYTHDFYVLAAPRAIEEAYRVAVRTVTRAIGELKSQFDYVVLDTTSGFNELNLAAIDMSDEILFVGILDFIPTIKSMKIGCDTLRSIGCDENKIKMILNRNNAKTDLELKDVEKLLGQNFFATVPNDFSTIVRSIGDGAPVVVAYPTTDLAGSLRQLAKRVSGREIYEEQSQEGLKGWLKKWL